MCTWFKHDSLASRDKKLVRLRADHGRNGVCMFWDILELMAYDNDHWLDLDIKQLYYLLGISSRKDKELLKQLILNNKYELFEYSDGDSSKYITPPPTVEELQSGGYRFTSRRLRESLAEIDGAKARRKAQAEEPREKPKRSYNLSDEGKAKLKQTAQNARIAKVNPNDNPSNPRKSNPNNPNEILESPETNPNDNPKSNPKEMRGIIGGEERGENGELRIESISPQAPQGGRGSREESLMRA